MDASPERIKAFDETTLRVFVDILQNLERRKVISKEEHRPGEFLIRRGEETIMEVVAYGESTTSLSFEPFLSPQFIQGMTQVWVATLADKTIAAQYQSRLAALATNAARLRSGSIAASGRPPATRSFARRASRRRCEPLRR